MFLPRPEKNKQIALQLMGWYYPWAAAQNQLETRQSAQCTLALVGCSD